MNYPSLTIFNKHQDLSFDQQTEIITVKELSVAYPIGAKNKLIILEKDNYFILGHVNINFRKKILGSDFSIEEFIKNNTNMINDLHWGFILVINKNNDQIDIINDIYGIYPIYYSIINNYNVFSNDFDFLIKRQEKKKFDINGLFDYFLFNYTLNRHTLFQNINQLVAGSRIVSKLYLKDLLIFKNFDLAKFLNQKKDKKLDKNKVKTVLTDCLIDDLDEDLPIQLPLSGGFDSKVLLSILMSSKKQFLTYTYGSENSVDHYAAELTAKQFNIPYKLLALNEVDVIEQDRQIKSFIRRSPGLPLILDLISYDIVRREIPESNIIIGAMGGELINGPVVISEVIITRSAKTLTCSKDKEELKRELINDLNSLQFLDNTVFKKNVEKYTTSLANYQFDKNDLYANNLTKFMLNETYAKFFGVVFKNLFEKDNLIFPFVDTNFLQELLNSEYRYSKHQLFSKSPLNHLFSRRLYAKLIKKIYKPALFTMMDRKYLLADILYFHRMPKTIYKYIENHFFKRNKSEKSKTLNYTKWFKPLIIEKLYTSPVLKMEIINKRALLDLLDKLKKNEDIPDIIIRKLIILLSVHYLSEIYNIDLSTENETVNEKNNC